MTLVVSPKLTPDEFLAWEREQTQRHHYVAGEVFAMAGGSVRHNALSARAIVLIGGRLTDGCRVSTSDQRLGLPGDEFVYADAVVVCAPLTLRPGTNDVVTNPVVVVEVLSRTTEAYDCGAKQKGYLALPSVQHFVLVSQREVRVEVYTRAEPSFRYDVIVDGSVSLERVGVAFTVNELYEGAAELDASLEDQETSPEAIEKAWADEITRRAQDLRERGIRGRDAFEVLAEIRAELSTRR